ncbi:DUF559 domain-containing protein [Demequina sp. SO4-18]|uniref:DUF559 domain-containing protein n=1 Tax=Demequina sp. SO4-18 TaxID=3401026 RepID=UPI003B5BC577
MRPLPKPGTRVHSLAAFLDGSAHAFARNELIRTWSRRQLDAAVAAGTVTRLLTGVYCGTAHALRPVVRSEALHLWHPAGAVTGAGALHLYEPRLPAPARLDYLVATGQRRATPPWVTLHQTVPASGRIIAQGAVCAEMPRALLDAWRFAPPAHRRNLLYEALWARVCSWRTLAREVERAPRVAGRRDLVKVLGWFAEGATTPLEVRAKHETFADARFRDIEWQAELRLGPRRVVADMLHRAAMVVVELDGDRYHSTREARDGDRERQNDLTAAGYVTIRLGWDDIVRRPERSRRRVLTVVAGRLERAARS